MFACCSSTPLSSPSSPPHQRSAEELRCVLHLTAPVEDLLTTCESLALPKRDTLTVTEVWRAMFHLPVATTLIEAMQWQQLHCTYWTLLSRECFKTHGTAVRDELDTIYMWRTTQKLGEFGEAAIAFPTDDQWARLYLWVVHDIPLLLQQEWKH